MSPLVANLHLRFYSRAKYVFFAAWFTSLRALLELLLVGNILKKKSLLQPSCSTASIFTPDELILYKHFLRMKRLKFTHGGRIIPAQILPCIWISSFEEVYVNLGRNYDVVIKDFQLAPISLFFSPAKKTTAIATKSPTLALEFRPIGSTLLARDNTWFHLTQWKHPHTAVLCSGRTFLILTLFALTRHQVLNFTEHVYVCVT
jgi:hypothetical protein